MCRCPCTCAPKRHWVRGHRVSLEELAGVPVSPRSPQCLCRCLRWSPSWWLAMPHGGLLCVSPVAGDTEQLWRCFLAVLHCQAVSLSSRTQAATSHAGVSLRTHPLPGGRGARLPLLLLTGRHCMGPAVQSLQGSRCRSPAVPVSTVPSWRRQPLPAFGNQEPSRKLAVGRLHLRF